MNDGSLPFECLSETSPGKGLLKLKTGIQLEKSVKGGWWMEMGPDGEPGVRL